MNIYHVYLIMNTNNNNKAEEGLVEYKNARKESNATQTQPPHDTL